jgi:hypothetical protein
LRFAKGFGRRATLYAVDEVLAELRYDAPARRQLAEAGVVKALTMDAEP